MRYPTAAFRPTDKNKNRLDMAKTLGINVSELINELLEKHGDVELRKKTADLQKKLERAKGFEPSTFTLARCASGIGLKLSVGGPITRPDVTPLPVRGEVPDSGISRDASKQMSKPDRSPVQNWGERRHSHLHS